MTKRTNTLIVAVLGVLILATSAGAQDEQWLQYHSEREAQRIIGNMRTVYKGVTTDKPVDVNLPQFKTSQQFFAVWPTTMVKNVWL